MLKLLDMLQQDIFVRKPISQCDMKTCRPHFYSFKFLSKISDCSDKRRSEWIKKKYLSNFNKLAQWEVSFLNLFYPEFCLQGQVQAPLL